MANHERSVLGAFALLFALGLPDRGSAVARPAQVAHAPRKEERSAPARYPVKPREDAEVDAQADRKRDEQLEALKKVLQKIDGEQKADLLFQLAELLWAKSRHAAQKGIAEYEAAFSRWSENKDPRARGPEPELATFMREADRFRGEAVNGYEEILRDFPSYPQKDEVLFAFAYNIAEMGRKDEALARYRELIAEHPKSDLVDDAYVQMGEHLFSANKLAEARTAYEKALASKSASIQYFALYKLAWCDYNSGAYTEAIRKLKEVVARARNEKGGISLKTEALNDLVRLYSQIELIGEAIDYFKKNAPPEQAVRLIAKLADQYQSSGKYEAAIDTLRVLVADNPTDARRPELQNAIIASYEALGRRDLVVEEMRRLVGLYQPSSPWAQANAGTPAILSAARETAERALRVLATDYHQEAQKTKAADTYRLARDLYKDYLAEFADAGPAHDIRFYYAEILWALNELEAAAAQYRLVAERDPESARAKASAYNAVLCYERLADAQRKGKAIGEVGQGQVDDKKTKSSLSLASVHPARDKGVQEEEIPSFEQKLVEAIDRYIGVYPGDNEEIALRYKAAFVFYDHNHDTESARRFREIITKRPEDPYSRKAADLTLHILETQQRWLELSQLACEFNDNPALVGGDKEFGTRMADLAEASRYKYIDETVYKAQKNPAQAGVLLRAFAEELPKSKYAPQALLYAMVAHSDAGQIDLAIEDGENLLKRYPQAKAVDGADLVARALLQLAWLFERIADYEAAADYCERYADLALRSKGDETEAAEALSNAALWNEALGRFDHAVALYARCVDRFPSRKEAFDLSFRIGLAYEKAKNFKEAARAFQRLAVRYRSEALPSKIFQAKYREALALREIRDDQRARAAIDELMKLYEAMPQPDREAGGLLDAYAHVRFLALDPLWAQYTSVKLKNIGRLTVDLTKKLEALERVEKGYAAVLAIGSADWGIAALTRIGMAYQDFARNLVESPNPRGLDEEQLRMYRGELEKRALPLEEKAIEAYEKALAKGVELSAYNAWTLAAQEQINALRPGTFLEQHETPLKPAEGFTAALTPLTSPPPTSPPVCK